MGDQPIRIRVLGSVEIWQADVRHPLPSRQIRTVLAALVLAEGQPISVDRLVELLWPDRPPRNAQGQIQVLVSRLRRLLGAAERPAITLRGGQYALDTTGFDVDLAAFARQAEAGRLALAAGDPAGAAQAMAAALAQWQGEPLLDVTDGLRDQEEQRLTDLKLAAVEDSLQAVLALGRHAEAIPRLRRLAKEHPLRERIASMLISALADSGRLPEASNVYEEFRQRLAGELGLTPSAALRQTYEAALRPAASGPVALPARAVFFVGRDGALAELDLQLERTDRQAPRRVIVTGLAGVGKTALAIEWAHSAGSRFAGGRIAVDLRGFDPHNRPLTTAEAARRVLSLLGVAPDRQPVDEAEAIDLYQKMLGEQRLLLVLDNARNSGQVRPLLPAREDSFVVITSRDRMPDLVAKEGAIVLPLGPLTSGASAELIGNMTGLAKPRIAQRLGELCGNLPLAVRIAAARIAGAPESAQRLVRELEDEGRRLAGLTLTSDEVSTRATFAMSYRLLTPEAAQAFRALGSLPTDDIAVAAAAEAFDWDHAAAGAAIAELASANLLQATGKDRYALHDLLRLYALELAAGDEAPLRRLTDYFLDAVDSADRVLRPLRIRPAVDLSRPPRTGQRFGDAHAALAWLDTEYQNIWRVMQEAARLGRHRPVWQMADCLFSYHLRLNRLADWLATDRLALECTLAAADRHAEGRIRTGMSAALCEAGRFEEAIVQQTLALEAAVERGDPAATASVHQMLSATYGVMGRADESIEHARAAYHIHIEEKRFAGAAIDLLNIGATQNVAGRFAEAVKTLEQALAQALTHLTEEQDLADVHASLAEAYRGAGRHEEAQRAAHEAVAVARRHEYSACEAEALVVLGRSYRDTGRPDARATLERALEIYRELDHPAAKEIEEELVKPW